MGQYLDRGGVSVILNKIKSYIDGIASGGTTASVPHNTKGNKQSYYSAAQVNSFITANGVTGYQFADMTPAYTYYICDNAIYDDWDDYSGDYTNGITSSDLYLIENTSQYLALMDGENYLDYDDATDGGAVPVRVTGLIKKYTAYNGTLALDKTIRLAYHPETGHTGIYEINSTVDFTVEKVYDALIDGPDFKEGGNASKVSTPVNATVIANGMFSGSKLSSIASCEGLDLDTYDDVTTFGII